MKLFFLTLSFFLLILSGYNKGYAQNLEDEKISLGQKDLLHHRFILNSINGKAFSSKGHTPSIEFNEGFRVGGEICNNYRGQAELQGETLTVKEIASTRKFCADPELNKLEIDFFAMLGQGAKITLKEGKILTLSRGEQVLEFVLRDWVR